MPQVHHILPPSKPAEVDVSLDEILAALAQHNAMYGGEDEQPPEPTATRHQLLNPDFWFFAGGTFCILLIFTSFIPQNVFEQLLFTGLLLNLAGLIANLTRERQGLVVHVKRIKIEWPRLFAWNPPPAPLGERH